MSRRKNFRPSNWLIELSPRKNVEPRIVGLRSTFRGSTFFRLVEIRLYSPVMITERQNSVSPQKKLLQNLVGINFQFRFQFISFKFSTYNL